MMTLKVHPSTHPHASLRPSLPWVHFKSEPYPSQDDGSWTIYWCARWPSCCRDTRGSRKGRGRGVSHGPHTGFPSAASGSALLGNCCHIPLTSPPKGGVPSIVHYIVHNCLRKAVAVYCVVSTRFVYQMASKCTRWLGSGLGLSAVHPDSNGLTPTATFRGRWRSELGWLPVITGSPAPRVFRVNPKFVSPPYNCVGPPIVLPPEARSSVYTKEFGLIQRRQVKSSSLLLCSSPEQLIASF